jgi:hypothetical protein
MAVSERWVCRVLGQYLSTQRKAPSGADDEAALTEDIIALARQYSCYGYRRVTALLRDAGWHVNRKRAERIWRCEGLKVPEKTTSHGAGGKYALTINTDHLVVTSHSCGYCSDANRRATENLRAIFRHQEPMRCQLHHTVPRIPCRADRQG